MNSAPLPPMRRYCKLRAAYYNAMKPPRLTVARHVQEHTAKGTETVLNKGYVKQMQSKLNFLYV
jgi:hypothetical protein